MSGKIPIVIVAVAGLLAGVILLLRERKPLPPSPPDGNLPPRRVLSAVEKRFPAGSKAGALKGGARGEGRRLRDSLRDRSNRDRMVRVRLLAATPDRSGENLALLRELALDTDEGVAHAALETLGEYAAAHPLFAPEVCRFLLDRAFSPAGEETRSVAAGAVRFDLLEAGHRRLYRELLHDGSVEVRRAVVATLGEARTKRSDAVRLLEEAYRREEQAEVRRAVIDSLTELGEPGRAALGRLRPDRKTRQPLRDASTLLRD